MNCVECGALLEPGRECREYFHEMLALEAQVPGGPGDRAHFYAVASYNLQHPAAFVAHVLTGLRATLGDVLSGRISMHEARQRARAATDGSTRVIRPPDDPLTDADRLLIAVWPTRWPLTVRDITSQPAERYVELVTAWAAAVVSTLDRSGPC
jgi:hypothetical protein